MSGQEAVHQFEGRASKISDHEGNLTGYAIDADAWREIRAQIAAHDAERDALAARVEAGLALLADEPMFVSGIRRAIDRNTDGYGRGGDITHTPRPGHRGSGSCPGDNLTGWLDRLTAALASPDPREHGTGGGDE